jgi:hypothetical protein
MSPLVFTPSTAFDSSLILSDGVTELELLGSGQGTYVGVDGFELPAPAPDNTYVETPDSEGRRRIRTRDQNAEGGTIKLWINHSDDALAAGFWESVDELLELVMSAHREKGTLTYQPPGGSSITYDLESIHISELPQRGHFIGRRIYEPVITFECKPFAKLAEVTIFEDEIFDALADTIVVDNIPGHADALVRLVLADNVSNDSNWIEVTVERDGSQSEPLTIQTGDFTLLGSSTIDTRADATSNSVVSLDPLPTDATIICEHTDRNDYGRKRVSGRFYTEEECWVRGAYRLGAGSYTDGPWRRIEPDNFREIHLFTVDLRQVPAGETQEVDYRIEAFASATPCRFDLDYMTILGGERRCAATQSATLLPADESITFFSDSVYQGGGYARIEGNYLTLPPSTRGNIPLRLAVRRRSLDISAGEADAGIAHSLLGNLYVTPRVALVGS